MTHEELEDSLRKHRADRDCWNTFEDAVAEWKTYAS
jgi:hypothetical protein